MACSEQININPLISVIIPCYNQGEYLPDALNSILFQTYTNWECIIINDGSTDYTETIVNQYLKKDNRFKYVFKENGGLSSTRNCGLELATGGYIQFLDADDFLTKDRFQRCIDIINEDIQIDLIISNYNYYYEESKIFYPNNYNLKQEFNLKLILLGWDNEIIIPIHCGLIKREVLSKFNEKLKAKEDWVMWVQVFLRIKKYRFIDDVLAYYRLHTSISLSKQRFLMEENTLLAYHIIYNQIVSDELKEMFFSKLLEYLKQLSQSKDKQIDFFKNSYSYRLGHQLLYPIKKLKRISLIKRFLNFFIKENYF